MNVVIENVDDGCEGYLKVMVNDKEIKHEDAFIFFTDLLETLGYSLCFVNTDELDMEGFD